MELWQIWTTWLADSIRFVSLHFGWPEAAAIIAVTVAARLAMMPVSLTVAYRAEIRKRKIEALKPEIERLKERHKDAPSQAAAAMMRLYRDNGITMFDRLMLVNLGSQGVFGLGIFQVLRKAGFSSKFLWIANIAKPDVLLTIVVAAFTVLGMAIAPNAAADTSMIVMLAVIFVIGIVTTAAMPSAVGIYWASSNAVTIVQTLLLRRMLPARRGT